MGQDQLATPALSWRPSAALKALAVFLLAPMLAIGEGRADDFGPELQWVAAPKPANQLELDITPYAWLINLNGEIESGRIRNSVQYTFFEILEDTETPYEFNAAAEVRKGPFSLFQRIDFLNIEVDSTVSRDLRPVRFFEIDVDANIDVKTDLLLLEGGASYALFKTPLNGATAKPGGWAGNSGFVALDVLGGVRYNDLEIRTDVEIDLEETLSLGLLNLFSINVTGDQEFSVRIDNDHSWLDPFIGGRVRIETPGGLEIFARGDVGGFDVGSKLVWNVIGGVSGGLWFCDNLSWLLAYRALDTDFESGDGLEHFEYDMLIHGPVTGFTYRF